MIRPPRHPRGTKANEGLYNLGKKKLGGFPAIARVENTVSLNLRLLSSVTYSQLSLTSRRDVFAVGGGQFYDSFYGWTFRLISISFIVTVVIVIHNAIIFGWKKYLIQKLIPPFIQRLK